MPPDRLAVCEPVSDYLDRRIAVSWLIIGAMNHPDKEFRPAASTDAREYR